MNRLTSTVLVIGGVVLLATQLISPASSAPSPLPSPDAREDQATEDVRAVNLEVDRLHDRLSPMPDFPSPVRDPFSFGGRPESRQPVVEPAPVAPRPRLVAPPKLVAILSDAATDRGAPRAAFAIGDVVEVVAVGDLVGAFRVAAISGDAVRLVESGTGQVFDLPLQ